MISDSRSISVVDPGPGLVVEFRLRYHRTGVGRDRVVVDSSLDNFPIRDVLEFPIPILFSPLFPNPTLFAHGFPILTRVSREFPIPIRVFLGYRKLCLEARQLRPSLVRRPSLFPSPPISSFASRTECCSLPRHLWYRRSTGERWKNIVALVNSYKTTYPLPS